MGATNSQEVATVVRVSIPSPLRSYTGGESTVALAIPVLAPEEPPQVRSVLAALDARFPGFRFRIVDEQGHVRPHIKVFVGRTLARKLDAPVPQGAEVMIVAALSGG
jgi:molybdopterin synthase sulfur carrier subunit